MSVTAWLRRLIGGAQPPDGFDGKLDGEERVLAAAAVDGGGHLVATDRGLWVPEPGAAHRRIGWHLVSRANWDGRALTVVEADELGTDGDAVLIADRPPHRYPVPEPVTIPEVVHARVTRSVLHSEQTADGLRVRRRVPGRDGVQVQLRRSSR
jgi:hypothetical protein